MKKNLIFKYFVIGNIILLLFSALTPVITSLSNSDDIEKNIESEESENLVLVSCCTYGIPEESFKQIKMSYNDIKKIFSNISKLAKEIAHDPLSNETKLIQNEIMDLATDCKLIKKRVSLDDIQPQFIPNYYEKSKVIESRGTATFCNFLTTGTGMQFPIITLPRLVPIFLTPIPRLFLHWNANEGITSCGSLLTGEGFIAKEMQRGTAFGFWGIGFSVFIPPIMQYGFIGYALYATCTAEEIEPWPPNYSPEISAVFPSDEEKNVPPTITELIFNIKDENGDMMDYSVTTNPDIGFENGQNKPGGNYSVAISGLEGSEDYVWDIEVSDGVETVSKSFTFSTQAVAPVISNPFPEENARHVRLPLSHLSFYIEDPQDDPMDFSIETSPDIGSRSESGVSDGIYSLECNNVDYSTEYKWYVNVTDGINWKRRVFHFITEEEPFDPFEEGWQYRKKITINHTLVAGQLSNFPILINNNDQDLIYNTQNDGDDIIFMENTGVSRRLFHEIENFDSSTGNLLSWVNILNLLSDEDTNFYMYYGNPNCNNQEHVEDTWINNFVVVCHMDDCTSSSIGDSTIFNNDGIKSSNPTIEVNGKIGKAQDFERDNNQYIVIIDDDSLDLNGHYTHEHWINLESLTDHGYILYKGGHYGSTVIDYSSCYHINKQYACQSWDKSHNPKCYSGKGSMSNTDYWYYTATTSNKGQNAGYKAFLNGFLVDSDNENTKTISNNFDLQIGRRVGDSQCFTDGMIDEIRISKVPRTQEWILTSFNTMNSPSSFLYFGMEESNP